MLWAACFVRSSLAHEIFRSLTCRFAAADVWAVPETTCIANTSTRAVVFGNVRGVGGSFYLGSGFSLEAGTGKKNVPLLIKS